MSEYRDVVALAVWLGFVLLGLVVVGAERRGRNRWRIRATNGFLVYTLLLTIAVGTTGRGLWPFGAWAMFRGRLPLVMPEFGLFMVDDAGEEHRVDYRAWHPITLEELYPWLAGPFLRLDEAAQQTASAYLISKAESARRTALAGGRLGTLDRVLGRLSAPTHSLHPRIWSQAGRVPERPLVAMRLVRVRREVTADPRADPGSAREIMFDSSRRGR